MLVSTTSNPEPADKPSCAELGDVPTRNAKGGKSPEENRNRTFRGTVEGTGHRTESLEDNEEVYVVGDE